MFRYSTLQYISLIKREKNNSLRGSGSQDVVSSRIYIAGILLILVLVLLSTGCGKTLSDAQYVERAQSHLDKGEWSAAFIELKNALQQNRDNAMARWMLGKLHLETGNYEAAEKELRRASELDVADGSVLPYLAQALVLQNKTEELRELSRNNIAGSDQKAVVLAAQGLAELGEGQSSDATLLIDRALSLDSGSVYALVAKARLLGSEKDYELARKQLDKVFSLDPGYAPAWSLLGDFEIGGRNLEKAEDAYTKAIEYRVDNLSDRLKRALLRIDNKQFEEAQKDIDELKKRVPTHSGVNYAQGLVYLHRNRYPEAQEAFELAIKTNEKHLLATYFLALTHLLQERWEQAESYGKRFLAAFPNSTQGRKLMATLNLQRQQYEAAERMLQPVVTFVADDVQALNLLADALLKQGKWQQATQYLQRVVDLEPDSAMAQFRLGVGLVAEGRQDVGTEHIQKALLLNPGLEQADVFLVLNYWKQNAYEKAIEAAIAYRSRQPDNAASYTLLGRIYLVTGQDAAAEEAFFRAREISPRDPATGRGLAALAIKKKQYDQAREYLQEVLDEHENDLGTLLYLGALDEIEGKEQDLFDHLQQAVTAHPDAVLPRVHLARYYLTQGKPEQVYMLVRELTAQQRASSTVLEVLSISQLERKQYAEAKFSLEQLVAVQPKSAQAHFLLARAFAGLKDFQRTKETLERAIVLDPEHFSARLTLARLHYLERNREALDDQLAILNKLSPDHPDVLRLKAEVAQDQDDRVKAAELLDQVFERFPTTGSMLASARQKWSAGDRDDALLFQEQWLMKNPEDLISTLALANAYSREGRIDDAIARYEQVLQKDDKNVFALNELAWFLRDKEPERALAYAKRATEIEPESPAVLDTLAIVLLKNGDIERAKRTIERVLVKDPKNPVFRYHSAVIDSAMGNRDGALKTLNALLNENILFSGRDEAKNLYHKLQAGG